VILEIPSNSLLWHVPDYTRFIKNHTSGISFVLVNPITLFFPIAECGAGINPHSKQYDLVTATIRKMQVSMTHMLSGYIKELL